MGELTHERGLAADLIDTLPADPGRLVGTAGLPRVLPARQHDGPPATITGERP